MNVVKGFAAIPPKAPFPELVNLFLLSQPGPDNVHACSKVYLASLAALASPPGALDAVLREPAVMRSCMGYFTSLSPRERLKCTRDSWSHCNCPRGENARGIVHDLHVYAAKVCHRSAEVSVSFTILHTIVLVAALRRTEFNSLDRSARNFWQKRTQWPMSLDDVVPYGLEHSINYLLEWACVTRLPEPFEILNQAISVTPGSIGNSLLVTHTAFAQILVQFQKSVLDDFTENPTARGAETAVQVLQSFQPMVLVLHRASEQDMHIFIDQGVRYVDDFLDLSAKIMHQVMVWEQLLAPISVVAEISSEWEEEIMAAFGSAVSAVLRIIGGPIDPARHHPFTLALLRNNEFSMARPFYQIGYPLLLILKDGGCARRGCHAVSVGRAKPFSRCAGCGIAHYCSKDCQRAAWKDTASAHKGICAEMKTFREIALPMGLLDYERHPEAFEAHCKSVGLDEAMTWRIVAHLSTVMDVTVTAL